jgi:spore coat polysaccharide biosynthesis predicted glycosyltransferase SpsG
MARYKIKISKENKKNKIVCFRVDWNSKIGFGHYKRCLALANLFVFQGYNVFLFTKSNINGLKKEGRVNILKIKSDTEAIKIIKKNKIKLIIMDIEHPYQSILKLRYIYKEYKNIGVAIICWDSIFKTNFPFQAIYRPYPNLFKFPNNPKVKRVISGLKYLYFENISKIRKKTNSVKNILVTLGAADRTAFLIKIMNIISRQNIKLKFHIVLKDLKFSKRKFKRNNIYFHKFFSNIHIALKSLNFDFAIISDGMTKYELAYAGIPSLVVLEKKNKRIKNISTKKNFGFLFSNLKNFEKNFKAIIENKKLLKKLSKNMFFLNQTNNKNIVKKLVKDIK